MKGLSDQGGEETILLGLVDPAPSCSASSPEKVIGLQPTTEANHRIALN